MTSFGLGAHLAHAQCFTYISLILKTAPARYYSPAIIPCSQITPLASSTAESWIYTYHLSSPRINHYAIPSPWKWGRKGWGEENLKRGGGKKTGGRGKRENTRGMGRKEENLRDAVGTCHQAPQQVPLQWPLSMRSYSGHEVHTGSISRKNFFSWFWD